MGKVVLFRRGLGDDMQRNEIVRTLSNLAAEADQQVMYLESLGLPGYVKLGSPDLRNVDELALEFDDAILVRRSLRRSGELSAEQLKCLLKLASILSSMSGQENAELWTIEALYTRREWKAVREKAMDCLQLFH